MTCKLGRLLSTWPWVGIIFLHAILFNSRWKYQWCKFAKRVKLEEIACIAFLSLSVVFHQILTHSCGPIEKALQVVLCLPALCRCIPVVSSTLFIHLMSYWLFQKPLIRTIKYWNIPIAFRDFLNFEWSIYCNQKFWSNI